MDMVESARFGLSRGGRGGLLAPEGPGGGGGCSGVGHPVSQALSLSTLFPFYIR